MRIGFDGKRAVQNFTGLGNYSRYLMEILCRYFPENEYLLYAPKKRESQPFAQFQAICPAVQCIYPDGLWRQMGSLWRSLQVTHRLAADGLDIYHGLSNELPLNIRQAAGVKSVVTIHDLIFLCYPHYYPMVDRRIYAYKFRAACEDASAIVAVSECTRRDIIRFFHIPEEKIHVIYQGCHTRFEQPTTAEERQQVRLKYRLPDRYILHVGSIEERKNMLLVVKALGELPDDVRLVIVGRRTKYTAHIEEYVRAHGWESRVCFRHQIASVDLPALYQMATLFVYPSRYEGFGIPIIEALHSGVPVIAATGSCLEEAGGLDSIYVGPDDVEGMAEAIRRVWEDDALRQRMATSGKAFVTRFSAEKQAAELMALYQSITEHN